MFNKISYKLIYYIFIISFIITSISLYIQLDSTYKKEIKSFENEIEKIQKNRVDLLAQSLWNVNTEAIKIFLETLLNDEKIIYSKIIESDGNVIESGVYREEDTIKKEFMVYKVFPEEKHYVGKLIIIADLASVKQELKNYVISTIFIELIKMLFIAFLIIIVVKQFLTNKIEQMANYANQLSLENLDQPLMINKKESKKNELDTVADSINKMRENLKKQLEASREKDNMIAHQSKMAAMGEMIGNIAHQWRQPLSVISSAASGLKIQEQLNILDEKDLHKSLDGIIKSTHYLSSTIDDFRDFFKPNKEKEYFEIKNVFDKTLTLVSSQFNNHQIVINKNIKNINVLGYENELIQVIINILNNAKDELIKKEKGIKRLIFIDSFIEEDEGYILIRDNAGGIPEKIIDRLFEPYFTTKDKSQGTGIGLYICEEIIVKHMNGSIFVENVDYTFEDEKYKGAQFKIILHEIK